ncbi:cytochrome c-type biogenesis protein [Methylibium petroleiphilum]
MVRELILLVFVGLPLAAGARDALPAAADPALEERVQRVTSELRCLVCQNQTLADSHAGLAIDLRRQVREMLQRGDTEQQIVDYMTSRYGDFVLYRPPVRPSTLLLWFGPGLLLLVGMTLLILTLHRRSLMAPDRFDPDMPDEPEEPTTATRTTASP